jgi:8-oxo-dGTP pyrophosphatase MutT (NUDIX family)
MSFIPPRSVRPIAICIVRRSDSILVFEGRDSEKKQTFYRPLGGSIEFGELGIETVQREFREEIGAELTNITRLGALENVFTYEGHPGHEIVLVYSGDLVEQDLYGKEEMSGFEDGGGQFRVIWKPISEFGPNGDPLYPDGLAELLASEDVAA